MNLKKLITIGTVVTTIGVTSLTAFATSAYSTPAEAVAGLTDRTLDSVITERIETGKTYGTIANEAGVLDEFKAEILEQKKDSLEEKVANGTMTQEEADEIILAMEENQTTCDGTGTARIGRSMGAGFGKGRGYGQGRGTGRRGNGLRNGSCIVE